MTKGVGDGAGLTWECGMDNWICGYCKGTFSPRWGVWGDAAGFVYCCKLCLEKSQRDRSAGVRFCKQHGLEHLDEERRERSNK